MENTNRINEIVTQITAFNKDSYTRRELLPELLKLQQQMVEILFNGTHADLARLKTWDVEKHLVQLNEVKGNAAEVELAKVNESIKAIGNMISAELSGYAGEKKAFWALQKVRGNKSLLKNIEFTVGDHRTELDGILLTPKAIFVIEVKNSRKNVVIDERGNFYRVSNSLVFDQNIGEKMSDKVQLLREALKDTESARLNIEGIVVFTNNSIEVENHFPYISSCYLSELPYKIDGYKGDMIYSEADLIQMSQMISEAACTETYPVPFDVEDFKYEFASLVAKLEESDDIDVVEESEKLERSSGRPVMNDNLEETNSEIDKSVNETGKLSTVGFVSGLTGVIIGVVASCLCKARRI